MLRETDQKEGIRSKVISEWLTGLSRWFKRQAWVKVEQFFIARPQIEQLDTG